MYAVEQLRVPPQVRIVGVGGGHTLYPRNGLFAGTSIVPLRRDARSEPLVVLEGPGTPGGVQLEGLSIDGYNYRWGGSPMDPSSWSERPGLRVDGGFEAELHRVRVARFRNTGIAIESLHNARWENVFVDLCGTASHPAMAIRSARDGATNFVVFDGLTIERSGNTALAIGAGDDIVRDWASNITFVGLHVESNQDTPGIALNTASLIDIGNVRAVTFVAPQLLGAPAPLVRYRQRVPATATVPSAPGGDHRDQQGGVQFFGGHLRQHSGNRQRVASIEATGSGRGLAVTGVRFAYGVAPAVRIDRSFSFDAVVTACSYRQVDGVPAVVDERDDDVVLRYWATRNHGNFDVIRDLMVGRDLHLARGARLGSAVSVAKAAASGPRASIRVASDNVAAGWVDEGRRGAGTDVLGRLWFRVLREPTDDLLRVEFSDAFADVPGVFLTPRKPATAALRLYVPTQDDAADVRSFVLRSSEPVPPSADTHLVEYLVIGRH